MLDEVRIATQARSQAWLATELYNQTVGKRLFTLGTSEELHLSAASIKRNKDGLNQQNTETQSQQEKANTLRGRKVSSAGEAPMTLTSSAEAIQARMENIRRVAAKENGK